MLSVIFYYVSDLLLFLSRVHFSICHLSGQIGLIDRRLESKDGKLHQHTSEHQRTQVRVTRWNWGQLRVAALGWESQRGWRSRSSVRSHHCAHSLLQRWQDWVVRWQVGGPHEAPCTNRTAVDKCFHLAGLWLPSLTLVRVHTSRYYCVSKMLSPLPGGGQEIIIAWHIFLYQCRPRANMAPLWLRWDSMYLCDNNNNDCISSK